MKWFSDLFRKKAKHAQLVSMFSHYVDRAVASGVDKLEDQVEDLPIVITKIKGYTSISEEYDLFNLRSVVQKSYAAAIECTYDCGGEVLALLNDHIVSIFRATDGRPNGGERSLLCALSILSKIKRENDEIVSTGGKPIGVSIGSDYGPVLLCVLGTSLRVTHAMLGPTVSHALVAASMAEAGEICLSASFFSRIRDFAEPLGYEWEFCCSSFVRARVGNAPDDQ